MADPSFDESPYFLWLVGWRASIALSALYTVLEKPLSTSLLTLIGLVVLLTLGEAGYRQKISYEKAKLRRQKEKELREKLAEEARLRYEQTRQQKRKSSLMSLDDDDDEDAAQATDGDVPDVALAIDEGGLKPPV